MSKARGKSEPEFVPRDTLADLRALVRSSPPEQVADKSAFSEASRMLDRIELRHRLTDEERLQLRGDLAAEMRERLYPSSLPLRAPELWSDREGRKENPILFIRRVYADWLGEGLRRSHIHQLDLPLYNALAVWLHRHPEAEFPELEI